MDENKQTQLLHIFDQEFYLPGKAEKSLHTAPSEPVRVLVLTLSGDLSDDIRQMLSRMLNACLLTEADYCILASDTDLLFEQINHFQPEFVLLFGLNLGSEAFRANKEKYKPFRFGGKKFLIGDSLRELSGSTALKSALWTQGLKPLFNIP